LAGFLFLKQRCSRCNKIYGCLSRKLAFNFGRGIKKSKIGETDTAKVQMALLDGKPFMFEFTYKSNGKKTRLLQTRYRPTE
jgi:hypothetical protein